jgi:hypothetical protein
MINWLNFVCWNFTLAEFDWSLLWFIRLIFWDCKNKRKQYQRNMFCWHCVVEDKKMFARQRFSIIVSEKQRRALKVGDIMQLFRDFCHRQFSGLVNFELMATTTRFMCSSDVKYQWKDTQPCVHDNINNCSALITVITTRSVLSCNINSRTQRKSSKSLSSDTIVVIFTCRTFPPLFCSNPSG